MSGRGNQGARPSLQRTIALSDAVVAIAMTLLVLPLVDLLTARNVANLTELWQANAQAFVSFVVSFVVISIFWTTHASLFRQFEAADLPDLPLLNRINMGWLLVIAFLPFTTALVGRQVTTGTAAVYLATLLVLSALTSAMTVVVRRAVDSPRQLTWLTTAIIGLCTVVSLFNAQAGMYLLLLLILSGHLESRSAARKLANKGNP